MVLEILFWLVKNPVCSWGTFAEASQTRFPKEGYNGWGTSSPKSYQEVNRASNRCCQLLWARRVLGSRDIGHATGVELLSWALSSQQQRMKDVGTPHGWSTLREQTSCEDEGPGWQILLELLNRAGPCTQRGLPGGCWRSPLLSTKHAFTSGAAVQYFMV